MKGLSGGWVARQLQIRCMSPCGRLKGDRPCWWEHGIWVARKGRESVKLVVHVDVTRAKGSGA